MWISVEDAPLVEAITSDYWVTTEAGSKDFIAAIPITHENKPSWEIGHARIEDGTLYWVLPDTPLNELFETGWEPDAISHYAPLPTPPESQPTDSNTKGAA